MNINKLIDHTALKPNTNKESILKLIAEAKTYDFASVCVNPCWVALAHQELKNTDVKVCTVIGFPLGANTTEVKVFETKDAIANGADEIDYVINITELKEKNYDYIKEEMTQIVDVCRKHNVISKVIFENCYLTDEEKIKLCEIALEVKPDFIKTSTGFGTGGATVEDVKLMKSIVKDTVKVKAAGGIRDLDTCLKMIEAGAERIGTSSAIKITQAYNNK